ncbi:MAG: amidase [Nakamurella sp.]
MDDTTEGPAAANPDALRIAATGARGPAAAGARGIVDLDAVKLSAAIRGRVVSCVEVMTAYLDQIDALNPLVNAIVSRRSRADLLAEASAKDRQLAAGDHLGWMHGFPHAVKDLANVAGIKTTQGFFRPPFDVPAASSDALAIERIRAAGAIFIGKTNASEFGLGSHTYNNVFGTTLNAYDQTRSAGGSSGGASVAVALRMLPVADGSDFFGSLRNPPAWNNLLGLRPSFGRVPGLNQDVFLQQFGVEGPIARTATDLTLLLQTMAGYDDRVPLSIEQDVTGYSDHLKADFGGAQVAWLGDLGGYLPMEPGVLELCEHSFPVFEALGMEVIDHPRLPTATSFAGNADLWPMFLVFRHWLVGSQLGALYRNPKLRAALKPEALYEVEGLFTGADGNPPITALDVYNASAKRTSMHQAFRKLFAAVKFVALPAAQVFAFDAQLHWPNRVNGVAMSSYHRWMEVTSIGTLLGYPVISLPVGFNMQGLPMGIQVIAANHQDLALLQLARAWEQETNWVQEYPPALLG